MSNEKSNNVTANPLKLYTVVAVRNKTDAQFLDHVWAVDGTDALAEAEEIAASTDRPPEGVKALRRCRVMRGKVSLDKFPELTFNEP